MLLGGVLALVIIIGIFTNKEEGGLEEVPPDQADLAKEGDLPAEEKTSPSPKQEGDGGSSQDLSIDQARDLDPGPDLYVHVDGAVNQPGIFKMPEGARVQDAIDKAGGLGPDADIQALNLAMRVQDEMKVYVPRQGEDPDFSTGSNASNPGQPPGGEENKKVNINTAPAELLETLPSIGPKRAEDIIHYREEAPFQSLEELKEIPGIGDKTFEKLKDRVTL